MILLLLYRCFVCGSFIGLPKHFTGFTSYRGRHIFIDDVLRSPQLGEDASYLLLQG